jgi:hypothetical protein
MGIKLVVFLHGLQALLRQQVLANNVGIAAMPDEPLAQPVIVPIEQLRTLRRLERLEAAAPEESGTTPDIQQRGTLACSEWLLAGCRWLGAALAVARGDRPPVPVRCVVSREELGQPRFMFGGFP